MINTKNYVWYCSYGSNISEKRFLCYIVGGQPEGSKTHYIGSRDKSPPISSVETYIDSELYFAKSSKTWDGGGVGFIRDDFGHGKTIAKMYLITEDQFIDVIKQENNLTELPNIDFNKLSIDGQLIIKEVKWYNKLIFLGNRETYPIITFTHHGDGYTEEINKPNINYLKIIIEGLKEDINLNEFDTIEYLESKKGIHGNYSKEEITEIIRSSSSI